MVRNFCLSVAAKTLQSSLFVKSRKSNNDDDYDNNDDDYDNNDNDYDNNDDDYDNNDDDYDNNDDERCSLRLLTISSLR